jgi:hypothetical protein
MRKIKGSSSYLKSQVRKNLAKATLSGLVFAGIFALLIYRLLSTFKVDLVEEVGLVFLLMPMIAFYFYLRKYHIYRGGWEGEKQVAKLLANALSDDYYLINDLYLRDGGGDIDHIILGPNGVFVLETKNWRGNFSCKGDEWKREGQRSLSSPSRQVKRNAAKIKQIIDGSSGLRLLSIWVEGIVVFTNKHSKLYVTNPTVSILSLSELVNYITTFRSSRQFSKEQLEAIGQRILKQKH